MTLTPNVLPQTNNFDKSYGGLNVIIGQIDHSKTQSMKISDNTQISVFYDKDGKKILEQQVNNDGGVSYYYKGHDAENNPVDIGLFDIDGDNNFDMMSEKYKNGNEALFRSSKDDGQFDMWYQNGKLVYPEPKADTVWSRLKSFFTGKY